MKKNKMMRIASVLLVAVLLSTSIISGTFAKYVTEASSTNSARVAKFGVVLAANGNLFSKTYTKDATDATGDTDGFTVKSEANVVAPGTKNDTGLTLSVTGTPEVDVKLTVAVAEGYKEVFLKKASSLPNLTTSAADDTFELTEDYYPVQFTLTQTKDGSTNNLVTNGKLSAVETELEKLSKYVDAGTDLANEIGTLKLTWTWVFSNNDKADTLLGELASGTSVPSLTAATDYCLDTSFDITISVTQVD